MRKAVEAQEPPMGNFSPLVEQNRISKLAEDGFCREAELDGRCKDLSEMTAPEALSAIDQQQATDRSREECEWLLRWDIAEL